MNRSSISPMSLVFVPMLTLATALVSSALLGCSGGALVEVDAGPTETTTLENDAGDAQAKPTAFDGATNVTDARVTSICGQAIAVIEACSEAAETTAPAEFRCEGSVERVSKCIVDFPRAACGDGSSGTSDESKAYADCVLASSR